MYNTITDSDTWQVIEKYVENIFYRKGVFSLDISFRNKVLLNIS